MPKIGSWKQQERSNASCTGESYSIRLIADFLSENMETRRQWVDIVNVLKGKDWQNRISNASKLAFKIKGEIMTF